MRKAGELGTKQLYNTQLLPLDREYYVQKKVPSLYLQMY